MAGVDAGVLLGLVAGILGTVAAFAAKYAFDYRLAKRRLELDERAAIASVLGGSPGQLRRAAIRLKDRTDGLFRDRVHLPLWLASASSPEQDGYFLRSSVQRLFAFVSWGTVVQQAIDALPPETLVARRDLQRQYALIDLSMRAMTSISMFHGFPGYVTEEDGFHLFTGTLDELADLGVATYNSHSKTIPHSAFATQYSNDPALLRVRSWLADAGTAHDGDGQSAVVMARMACLGAIADAIARPETVAGFAGRADLSSRLALIDSDTTYALAESIPAWLDAELARIMTRWTGQST